MLEKLNKLLDEGFKGAPYTDEAREIKEEIRLNIEEKYNDLISQGVSPEEAYETVASGLGDFRELVAELNKANTSYYGAEYQYTGGGGALAAADVTAIDVYWTSGNVDVIRSSDARIHFSEEISGNRNRAESEMVWRLINGKLIIEFLRPGLRNFIGWWQFPFGDGKKRLTLALPEGVNLEKFAINSVSANVEADGSHWRADVIDINTVNGTLNSGRLTATRNIKLSTVNGRFGVTDPTCGGELKISAVNGALTIINPTCQELRGNTVNGRIIVELNPEISGFTAKYGTVNGPFECDFPVTMSKKIATYGDGKMQMKLDTVNGGIKIAKN